jgi:methanogenic corrinoid protein MtbC1
MFGKGAQRDGRRPADDNRLEILQRAFADALLHGDEPVAESAISQAIEAAYDEAVIDEHIVAPALRLVGDMWAAGDLNVADEHHATEISMRVLTLQREAFRVARRRGQHRVLLAAVQGEQHTIGLRMAGSLLLHAGFDVRMLGPDLPLAALASAVLKHRPAVVGLSATLPGSAGHLLRAAEMLRATTPTTGVIVGGAGVGDRFDRMPGVVVSRHVADVVGQVEGLAQRAAAN